MKIKNIKVSEYLSDNKKYHLKATTIGVILTGLIFGVGFHYNNSMSPNNFTNEQSLSISEETLEETSPFLNIKATRPELMNSESASITLSKENGNITAYVEIYKDGTMNQEDVLLSSGNYEAIITYNGKTQVYTFYVEENTKDDLELDIDFEKEEVKIERKTENTFKHK